MQEEVTTNLTEVKTASDGTVKISIEKYNDLIEKAAEKPAVINRTTVVKTAEMASRDYRIWGGTFMGLGAAMFIIGVRLYKAGSISV